jgi:16S rRNA processing protein RimM
LKKADLVALGKVIRSQGREGHVKLRLSEKGPTGFRGTWVYLSRGDAFEAYEIESLVVDRNATILKLAGVDTLAAADALVGYDVCAAESDFPDLGRDRFYDFQIIGSRVRTRDGAEVGDVAAVLDAGGSLLLVVRRGDRDVYIPFTEPICVKVDAEAREVVIDPPDGLLDLNEI